MTNEQNAVVAPPGTTIAPAPQPIHPGWALIFATRLPALFFPAIGAASAPARCQAIGDSRLNPAHIHIGDTYADLGHDYRPLNQIRLAA
jgi:hypothetical protein